MRRNLKKSVNILRGGRVPQFLLDQFPGAEAAFALERLTSGFGSTGSAAPQLNLTNNGVTQGEGKVGNAGVFDGSSYLSRSQTPEFKIGSDPFTVETWLNVDVLQPQDVISTYDNGGWIIGVRSADQLRFYADGNDIGDTTIQTSTWYHAVAVYNGSNAIFYVDDNQKGSTASPISDTTIDLNVGRRPGGSNYLDGKIAPIRIWNGRALTSTEISTLYNNGDGLSQSKLESDEPQLLDDLVAAYTFEDSQDLGKDVWHITEPAIRDRRSSDDVERDIGFDGNDLDESGLNDFHNGGNVLVPKWYDQSPNQEHVTQSSASNQPRIVNGGTIEEVDGRVAMHFDPSQNQYLINSSHPFASKNFTALVWARYSTASVQVVLVKGSSSSDRNAEIYFNGSDELLAAYIDINGNFKTLKVSQNINSENWYFIAQRYDGSEHSLFLNGTKEVSRNDPSPKTNNSSSLEIGRFNDSDYFHGYIATPLLFPRALSDSEIQDIYERTS